ncbi:MAG: winged helix-turn-helix transcriptional regulator [Cyanobacteria bacterium SZAS-4]|nr:winged helix-turn-helix transcriptional regulator [Cyanobacteria bacterium SZAS-4]
MSPNRRRAKKLSAGAAAAVSREKLTEFKAEFFKALANPIRIRILDELRDEELTVSEIRDRLDIELPNISQQLAILKGKKLVIARRQGTSIHYSCSDRTVFELLDVAKEIFNNHLVDIQETLNHLQ